MRIRVGLAIVAGFWAVFLLIDAALAHDGDHSETSGGSQYTTELLVAGVPAAIVIAGLAYWWIRRRQSELDS